MLVSAGSRGGRRAGLPAAGWELPSRFADDERAGTRVRFTEELSGRTALFDFGKLAAAPAIQQWLARAFARSTGPRSGVKRVATARGRHWSLKAFAECLGLSRQQARGDLAAACSRGLHRRRSGHATAAGHGTVPKRLRAVLREDPELPEARPARSSC